MGTNKLVPTIRDGDWNSVRRAISKLASKLGTGAVPAFSSITLSDSLGLTFAEVSKLLGTDASKNMESKDLIDFVTGTANEVNIADDGDGTITLSTPQDTHTEAIPTFAGGTFNGTVVMTRLLAGGVTEP